MELKTLQKISRTVSTIIFFLAGSSLIALVAYLLFPDLRYHLVFLGAMIGMGLSLVPHFFEPNQWPCLICSKFFKTKN